MHVAAGTLVCERNTASPESKSLGCSSTPCCTPPTRRSNIMDALVKQCEAAGEAVKQAKAAGDAADIKAKVAALVKIGA